MTIIERWTDEHTGLPCAAMHGPMGNVNGYVGVPEDHPWHGKSYGSALCEHDGCWEHEPDSLVSVHGGITYSGDRLPKDDEPVGLWWFGFDTAHAGDLVPALGDMGLNLGGGPERQWDVVAVKAECALLAEQLADYDELESWRQD